MSRDNGTELALSGVTNGSLDDKGEFREQLSRASEEIRRLQEELRREREKTPTRISTQDSFLSQDSPGYLRKGCRRVATWLPTSSLRSKSKPESCY